MSPSEQDSLIKSRRTEGDAVVVDVSGEIDMTRSLRFQEDLLKVLDEARQTVVVDLTDVPYMDSSGVASLVKLLSRAKTQNKKVALAGLTDRVRSILEITRLNKVFDVYDTPDEALNA
jgi:anti-sigma B factor antagonist